MDTIPRAQRSARRYAAALLRDTRNSSTSPEFHPMTCCWQRPPQWAVVGLAYAQARWLARWQGCCEPYIPDYAWSM